MRLTVRKVMSRGRGPYFQYGYSYRDENGKPRFKVLVHLGIHPTPEEALTAWPADVERLRAIGRATDADRLAGKLATLRKEHRKDG